MRLLAAFLLLNCVSATGQNYTISTFAGNGTAGYSGDGGPATRAELSYPWAVAVDLAGNVYIAEGNNSAIRRVAPDGTISIVAYYDSWGLAVDSAGGLYFSFTSGSQILKRAPDGTISIVAGSGIAGYSGDGGPATSAQLNTPIGVAVDAAGNLYIADGVNQRIRKVGPDGTISTLAGNGSVGYSGDGGPAASAEMNGPAGIAVDTTGNLYIADEINSAVRMVSPDGTISTVAGNGFGGYSGDGGPAAGAQLAFPCGVAVDASGSLYIADSGSEHIRKISDGVIRTIAGNETEGYSGDGGWATFAAIGSPVGVAVAVSGYVFVADITNNVIRLLVPHHEQRPRHR